MTGERFRGMQVTGFGHPGSDLRRELTGLVLAGTKTATAGLLVELELDGDELPRPGMREVVLERLPGRDQATPGRPGPLADR